MGEGEKLNDLTSSSDGILKLLQNLNNIRVEIAKLNISPEEKVYFDNVVRPLLDNIQSLSLMSYNFSVSALNLSNISLAKTSKVKEALSLVYDINEDSKQMYEELHEKLKEFMNIIEETQK